MKMARKHLGAIVVASIATASFFARTHQAGAGPIDIALNPSPQATDFSCQSYSFALAMAFNPGSPFKANTTGELRDLERSIRKKMEASATAAGRATNAVQRSDWPGAVNAASNGALVVKSHQFTSVDKAMHFVADTTGVPHAEQLGPTLSLALVKTPVVMSFRRIKGSDYTGGGDGSHIATVFGVELPPQSMGDDAKPKLLIVNSAVKYGATRKNVCWDGDLSDHDKYMAEATLTSDYDLKNFGGKTPYPIDTVVTH